jgi:putative copper resistance protein D
VDPDTAIVAARFLQFGSALVLFGSSLFALYGFRSGGTPTAVGGLWFWPRPIVLIAALGALLGVFGWIAAQAAIFFPDAGPFDPGANWILLTETQFGRVAFARAGLIALSIVVSLLLAPTRAFWFVQSALATLIVASFAWTGHGIRDTGWAGTVHTGADVLHVLAAGIWIGALVPLSILILRSLHAQTEAETRRTSNALAQFSGIGPAIVAVLVLTGFVNSWFLVGIAQWQALFTTNYGLLLTAKIGLFGGMLLLAAANRYRFSPRLTADLEQGRLPRRSLRALRASVMAETSLAILVLAAVAMLGTLEPPVSGG